MFLSVVFCMAIAVSSLFASRMLLHYFQLESYQFPGYFKTIRRNIIRAILPGIGMTILLFVIVGLISVTAVMKQNPALFCFIGSPLIIGGGYVIGRFFSVRQAKKAFVFTPRVKRLYAVSFIVMTLIIFSVCRCTSGFPIPAHIGFEPVMVFPLLLPLWIALCGLLAWPIEKAISEMYFRDAQKILRERTDLIRIGITGSWGKTSVKFILGTILEEKYRTLITPSSFNTPMGVTKVIRTGLEPGHRIFVAEMGARHVGDIKEMCRLVHPCIGILTSVGPQHLDTFKTVEQVARTKYELIEALPDDGEAFFADDEDICRMLYLKTAGRKHLAGLDPLNDEIWAEEIRYSPEGSSFVLCSKNMKIRCSTQMLGELNIRNIILCASVALALGLNMEQIGRGIARIKPVEHRLQLIRHPGGLNVIDDAFNSNIRGAKQAFQVLKQFPRKRVIVTPGMVELGDQEFTLNKEFGASMAGCCDTVILVGRKRSEAIVKGLTENGFSGDDIRIVSSLEEATVLISEITVPGDTVLFENDLPDNYTES